MTEVITDYGELLFMTEDELAIQVALRQGYTVDFYPECFPSDSLAIFSETKNVNLPMFTTVKGYLNSNICFEMLEELDNSFYEVEWFKTNIAFYLKCYYNDEPYKAKVNMMTIVSRKHCIVLAWIQAFDKGLLK